MEAVWTISAMHLVLQYCWKFLWLKLEQILLWNWMYMYMQTRLECSTPLNRHRCSITAHKITPSLSHSSWTLHNFDVFVYPGLIHYCFSVQIKIACFVSTTEHSSIKFDCIDIENDSSDLLFNISKWLNFFYRLNIIAEVVMMSAFYAKNMQTWRLV